MGLLKSTGISLAIGLAWTSAAQAQWQTWGDGTREAPIAAQLELREQAAALTFFCDGNFFWVDLLGGGPAQDRVQVELRFEDGHVSSEVWFAQQLPQLYSGRSIGDLGRRVARSQVVTIKLGEGEPVAVSTPGAIQMIHPVMRTCGVPMDDPMGRDERMDAAVVETVDSIGLEMLETIQTKLLALGYPVQVNLLRDDATYLQASLFTRDYWAACRRGLDLGAPCLALREGNWKPHWIEALNGSAEGGFTRTLLNTPPTRPVRTTSAVLPPRSNSRRLDDVIWIARPTPTADDYPPRAVRLEVEGSAQLQCPVLADGWLASCRIVSETPGDYGFGQAALRVARRGQVDPASLPQDGEGGYVTIALAFRL